MRRAGVSVAVEFAQDMDVHPHRFEFGPSAKLRQINDKSASYDLAAQFFRVPT